MVTVYEKLDAESGKLKQHAFEAGGNFFVLRQNGCVPMYETRGRVVCACEAFLQKGYCRDMEIVDIIQHGEYGFSSREIPKAVVRDSALGIVWVLTDNIYPVKNGTCHCAKFRTSGRCDHTILAKS